MRYPYLCSQMAHGNHVKLAPAMGGQMRKQFIYPRVEATKAPLPPLIFDTLPNEGISTIGKRLAHSDPLWPGKWLHLVVLL